MAPNPLTGSTALRKGRNRQARMEQHDADSVTLRYKSLGSTSLYIGAGGGDWRVYVPGMNARLANAAGADVASYYATGVFRPGTQVRWEPTISPITGGRAFVGFTDNPEIMAELITLWNTWDSDKTPAHYAAYSNKVKGLGNLVSFPLWQEWSAMVPTKLRRKRFDCNASIALNSVDSLDRSAQVAMFACYDGAATGESLTGIGSFWYHDVLHVEGLHGTAT